MTGFDETDETDGRTATLLSKHGVRGAALGGVLVSYDAGSSARMERATWRQLAELDEATYRTSARNRRRLRQRQTRMRCLTRTHAEVEDGAEPKRARTTMEHDGPRQRQP
jgi:hypothetical protein